MPPTPRTPDAPAFPRSFYAKYKRATSYFLHWLLRARDGRVDAPGGEDATKLPLDVFDQIVRAIAQDATALPRALLRVFPHALHACECAITLRTRVAAFFGESADEAHAHFVERMTGWLHVLQATTLAMRGEDAAPRDERQLDFSNYYDVLALPDDYFDGDQGEEDSDDKDKNTTGTGSSASLPRTANVDDTAASDFQTELACMLMELEELNEAVYAAFYAVRQEEKTLLEAAVVSKVAIDCAASVIANFQLRHPSVENAEDLVQLILGHMPQEHIDRLKKTVTTGWQPSKDAGYQYVRGTIVIELVGLTRALVAFSETLKGRPRAKSNPQDPLLKSPYDDDAAQDFVVPDWSGTSAYFQACALRLLISVEQLSRFQLKPLFTSLQSWLQEPLKQLAQTGAVSTHVVFFCSCWARSVAAIHGENRQLGRTISAAFMHMWDLEERLHESQGRISDRGYTHLQRGALLLKFEATKYFAPLMRASPLIAGSVMLDNQFQYLLVGSDALMISMFQAFSHIYSALLDRRLLDEIPLLEETIRAYEEFVFTPSRASATQGSFAQSFVLSNNHSGTLSHGKPTSTRASHMRSVLVRSRFENLSRVAKLIHSNDYSVVSGESRASWKTLLSAVSDIASEEVRENRLFSRDSLRLCDDIMDVCYTLCDELGRRPHYEQMIAKFIFPDRALENAIMFPLLPTLDSLEHPGHKTLATLPQARISGEALLKAVVTDGSARSQLMFCHRAAMVIRRRFGRKSLVQRNYFTYPSTTKWISSEFGRSPFASDKPSEQAVLDKEFQELMRMFESSTGPLRGKDLDEFKLRVITRPSLLTKVSSDTKVELWSLLHQAAAGPGRDIHLVEWLIQMGALIEEAGHYHKQQAPGATSSGTVFNALAVHCAAKRGFATVVQHIVEANCFRDIDTLTHHTKETLLQLAVKAGDSWTSMWLTSHGANSTGKDASGKYIWELTTNPAWTAWLKYEADQWTKEHTVSLGTHVEGSSNYGAVSAQAKKPQLTSTCTPQAVEDTSTCREQPMDSTPCSGGKKSKRKKKKKSKSKTRCASSTSDSVVDAYAQDS